MISNIMNVIEEEIKGKSLNNDDIRQLSSRVFILTHSLYQKGLLFIFVPCYGLSGKCRINIGCKILCEIKKTDKISRK